ncbi:MAG TPA: DeoR/GlpR family DNA-binding transcription regulator [Dyella sp.]|uniref:DeoR/GlpR family DNA-binding transcription regulator n=1 Tax=Dyella sp. TaxID=1869338 RepID=UPI002F92ED97
MAKLRADIPAGEIMPQERQQRIVQRLRSHGRVVAAELAVEFEVSEDSIRRDLRELAAQGLCKRVYGGALALAPGGTTLKQRAGENIARKQALARKAVTLVRAGQILLMDASSTNTIIAAALPERSDLTVVTNAPDIAQVLMDKEGVEILLIGGRVNRRLGATMGAKALLDIQRVRADICFPGACAIDAQSGLWGFDSEEVQLKRAMIESAGAVVVVATVDKIGVAATHHVADIEDVQYLIVENDTNEASVDAFVRQNVSVLYADLP